ncbi:MAG: 2-phospho-L-lactate transferase [Candidatus Hodarchaeota archaeon]
MRRNSLNVTVLSGGTGTPKLLQGLQAIPDVNLSVIANTGDDWNFYGLYVSPDCDSVLFALAGILDQQKMWGITNDSFGLVDGLRNLLHEDIWFNLGDRDAAISMFRSSLLAKGNTLTKATQIIANKLGISAAALPMANERVQTLIETEAGLMHLEEFWVRDRGNHTVRRVIYDGASEALVTAEIRKAIEHANLLIIGPSNPISSIGPILEVGDLRTLIKEFQGRRVAVSPIIGKKPLSGPAGQFMKAMGYGTTPVDVARCYQGLIDELYIDMTDGEFIEPVRRLTEPKIAPLIMRDMETKKRLAQAILEGTQYESL